jgi:hypothetical protein
MKLSNYIIKPLLYGNWLLRTSNNDNVLNDLSYITIKDNTIKIKTIDDNGIFGLKTSRTAYINNLTIFENNTYLINLNYSTINMYSYSFFGISIPEIKFNSLNYNNTNNLYITVYDNIMFVEDKILDHYYIYDLKLGIIKNHITETSIHTLIFTNIFNIILNILITQYLQSL